jgi:transposase-like protein
MEISWTVQGAVSLRSGIRAARNMGLRIEHRQHKGRYNRAENSHFADEKSRADYEAIQIAATDSEVPLHSQSGR